MRKAKNPALAAGLNFFLLGLGYVYVGKRRLFGWLIFASYVISVIIPVERTTPDALADNPWLALSGLLIMIAFAWDAWQEARKTHLAREIK
jgi:hypothetical protein